MTDSIGDYRRFYAEEIQVTSNIRTPELVEAFAAVPRERFLPPGPWVIRGEADFQSPLRHTVSDDPRWVYHNLAIGIQPARMLFNGAPGFVGTVMDALGLGPGKRVLHIGAGAGYYTAVAAAAVGPSGRVLGIEVDADLAALAAANLRDTGFAAAHVEIRHGDASAPFDEPFDAVLINTGLTHPERHWLDALVPGGKIVVPLTASMPSAMTAAHPAGATMANISKGLMVVVTRTDDRDRCSARLLTFVAIYSAMGLRDEVVNAALGKSLQAMPFPQLKTLRFDQHEPEPACWCHTLRGCWSTGES